MRVECTGSKLVIRLGLRFDSFQVCLRHSLDNTSFSFCTEFVDEIQKHNYKSESWLIAASY